MNDVIMSFDPNEKQSVIARESYEIYESSSIRYSVKSARKAKDKLHKACERASEIHE